MNNLDVNKAIDIVLFLLAGRCSTIDRHIICQLLEYECIKTGGELPIALLVYYVASELLNKEAVKLAFQGKVTIDVLVIDYTKQANELRQIAKELRLQADSCKDLILQPAIVVSMVNHCVQPLKHLYHHYCCELDYTSLIQESINCSFNCCEEC